MQSLNVSLTKKQKNYLTSKIAFLKALIGNVNDYLAKTICLEPANLPSTNKL
jgi:hypothetical protein